MTGPQHDPLVEVHLRQLPVQLWATSQELSDDLLREFALVVADLETEHEHRPLPARLLDLVQAVTAQFAGAADVQEAQLFAAVEAGTPEIDLVYRLPPAAGPAAAHLETMLDEADAYCRAGRDLLTLAAPEEVVTFRHWFLGQFSDQLAGRPAVAWPDYRG